MPIHGYPGNVITANPVAPTSTVATGVWTMEQQLLARSAGNWPFTIPTQQISRSLRFNSADSAYLNRTLTTPTNNKIFTFSTWVKRSGLAANQTLFDAFVPATSFDTIRFNSSDQLDYFDNTAGYLTSTQVFRDVSAWYHIVAAVDTTQATSSNRVKLYVNGIQITAFSASAYPSQNQAVIFNSAVAHGIGRFGYSANAYLNGYMTEVYFVDGQQLTPSSFGQTNASTGVWEPINYTGTYGTNGFYLNFSDNSNTTAATLGKDYSGNGNNWTPNNFSVTAGVGNDSLVDTPTSYGTDTGVGGEVRGNYATWNPLDKNSNGSLLNGNLDNSNGSANNAGVRSTFALPSSDKWYAELRVNTTTSGSVALGFGFSTSTADLAGSVDSANKYVIYGSSSGYIFSNTSTVTSSLGTFTAGDILQVAYDGATGKAWLGKNNTWYNSTGGTTGDPGAGNNQTFTLTGQFFLYSYYYNVSGSLNCGQRAFAYTAPSGFKALCTQNLPTPTIGATSTTQANDYFDVTTYSGSASSQSITNSGSMQPDFVWIKCRNTTDSHNLTDAVRGTNKNLFSNSTAAEDTVARLTSFNSNGVTLAGGYGNTNNAGQTYVAWQWRASNAAGVSNTAGTITSTVSANTTSGFSIATLTAQSSGTGTFGHGLGVAPSMVITKLRAAANAWATWHISIPNTQYLELNTTNAAQTAASYWNSTSPTSSVVSLGTAWAGAGTMVAYCFAPVASYSSFGSYVGNGSTDGPFVYLGFRPAYVLIKSSSQAGTEWEIRDDLRLTYNPETELLFANSSSATYATDPFYKCDLLSNGFKLRNTNSASNGSGYTYVYAAFAENPFKYSLAR